MITINDKKDCIGCSACASVCPKSCIYMKNDHEGFWYPELNHDACINCGMCIKVCPIINKETVQKIPTAWLFLIILQQFNRLRTTQIEKPFLKN